MIPLHATFLVGFLALSGAAPGGVPWTFTIHGAEVGHDLTRARKALAQVVRLGGRSVRTDVFWHEVEPRRGVWKASKLRFYEQYLEAARAVRLEPLVILSGAPGWAVTLYGKDPAAFFRAYEAYVRRVVKRVAARVDQYQLWNEANHLLVDPIKSSDDWQLFARAGRIVRALDPKAVRWVNVLADMPGWESAVTRWLRKAGPHIDGIGIDHYPGTWSWRAPDDWAPLRTLLRRINTPGDRWYGKRGALLETGYSTWPTKRRGVAGQSRWIRRALPALRALLGRHAKAKHRLELLGWYQLVDARHGLGQEGHFGVLRADLSAKASFKVLREELAKFRPASSPPSSRPRTRAAHPASRRDRARPARGARRAPPPPTR